MALASHTPATWDDLLSTTLHNYHKTLTNNIWNSRPGLNYFMEKGRVRKIDGGISIVEPLIYEEGDSGSYTEWQRLTVTPKQGIGAAQFNWRQLYATIAISGLEEAQNNSKQAAINLLEAKIMQAEETLKTRLSKQIWKTQTSPAYDANVDFGSLTDYIDSTGSVGGLDQATNSWWASTEVDGTGGWTAVQLESNLRAAYHDTSDSGSDHVDAMFSAADPYEFYESTLTPQVRYTDTSKVNLGFMNLLFKQVPWYWDFDCPANTVFGVNSKYVGLVFHSDRYFQQTPFSSGLGGNVASNHATDGTGNSVDARYAFITTYGNLTIRNRKRHFKLTNVTAA